jgi:hypothetical protein
MEGLGEETVTRGVERGALFAVGRFGTGGILGVGLIGAKAGGAGGYGLLSGGFGSGHWGSWDGGLEFTRARGTRGMGGEYA